MDFGLDTIRTAALSAITEVHLTIRTHITNQPWMVLTPEFTGRSKKAMLSIDKNAELRAIEELQKRGLDPQRFLLIGEESLRDTTDAINARDLTKERRTIGLLDMVDGTDLLERGLSNWCSAIVFCDPQARVGQKILAAFVGLFDDCIYYATRDSETAFKYKFKVIDGEPRETTVTIPSDVVTEVENSSMAFVGQQVSHFTHLARNSTFLDALDSMARAAVDKGESLKLRIYNLAGIPMMMKLIDGHKRIDAIFETVGQQPHDMVAGAFIAIKAGACLLDLQGNAIDLEEAVLHPANSEYKKRYVLGSNSQLCTNLIKLLNP